MSGFVKIVPEKIELQLSTQYWLCCIAYLVWKTLKPISGAVLGVTHTSWTISRQRVPTTRSACALSVAGGSHNVPFRRKQRSKQNLPASPNRSYREKFSTPPPPRWGRVILISMVETVVLVYYHSSHAWRECLSPPARAPHSTGQYSVPEVCSIRTAVTPKWANSRGVRGWGGEELLLWYSLITHLRYPGLNKKNEMWCRYL